MKPTIVFAGANAPALRMLREADVDSVMVSYMAVQSSAQLRRAVAEPGHRQRMYLDSGVFTFMRRAGVAYQVRPGSTKAPASWEEFLAFAKEFVAYVTAEGHHYDHIVELDVDELFGVKVADMFRANLVPLLGDRLLPVWHAQRGREGWSEMVRQFKYVCLSPTKAFKRDRDNRADTIIREMIQEAHDNDCDVHILGVEKNVWFDLGADSIDASSWASGARWGQYKLPNGGRDIFVPRHEKKKRRPLSHAQLAQFRDVAVGHGYSLSDLQKDDNSKTLGIKLLMARQEEARARIESQTAG